MPKLKRAVAGTIRNTKRAVTNAKVRAVGNEQIEHRGGDKKLRAGWRCGYRLDKTEHRRKRLDSTKSLGNVQPRASASGVSSLPFKSGLWRDVCHGARSGLTTQAQRPGARYATLATATPPPG